MGIAMINPYIVRAGSAARIWVERPAGAVRIAAPALGPGRFPVAVAHRDPDHVHRGQAAKRCGSRSPQPLRWTTAFAIVTASGSRRSGAGRPRTAGGRPQRRPAPLGPRSEEPSRDRGGAIRAGSSRGDVRWVWREQTLPGIRGVRQASGTSSPSRMRAGSSMTFATDVRIEVDLGQHLVTGGPQDLQENQDRQPRT